jgi:hypothetical protein
MTNYARVINNTAVELSTDPTNQFHPTIADQFQVVPSNVKVGWTLNASVWSAPAPVVVVDPVPPAPVLPFLTPVQFKMCFTTQERIAITAIKATDVALKAAYEILDDPRLTQVDLNLQSVKDMVAYIHSLNIITPERMASILAGTII